MTQRPIRLGLPWMLPHYRPLNGPHPLVRSFLEGNAAIEALGMAPVGTVAPTLHDEVLQRMEQQARQVPDEHRTRFLEWLNLPDQLAIESQAADCDALFLHTTPLGAGSNPWIFHFESFPSLFMPFMFTGNTRGIDLLSQDWFRLVRDRLASGACRGIFSHLRSSLEILIRVCDSPAIAAKCHHVPLGIEVQPAADIAPKFERGGGLRILFTNSLHGNPDSFYLRGGHHLLEAFARLRRTLPDVALTVLSAVPADLMARFPASHFAGVDWIDSRVDDATLDRLFLDHHLFALPAAGLHSHSLLRAMAHGCVPIVSDALGYEEYTRGIEDSVLSVNGVRAMVYHDEPAGWVSDRYAPFLLPSPDLVQQIHDRVAGHAAPAHLHRLALRNLEHCRRHHAVPASHAAFNHLLQVRSTAGPQGSPPMKFSIWCGNHGNSSSITDTVLFLKNALQDCGHRACISHRIEPGQVNIVLEHFVDEKRLRELLDGHAAGARYILIGTEPIVGGTFNGGIDDSHWHYSNRDYWKLRFDAFKVAARLADAIWVLADSMVPAYAELFPQLPVRFLPHGWVDGFAAVRQRAEEERDIDFYFSGSLTEHRKSILAELARRHVVVYNDHDTPEYLRQDQLSRSKVCLSLRLSPANRIPSVSRMHFHLQNRSFLVHEAYELPCPLDPFVLAARGDDLVSWALAALQLPNRREIADGVHEQFKAALPMTKLLPPLLDEALARIARQTPVARAA